MMIHVAGPLVDCVQRCTRCGEVMSDYRGAMIPESDRMPTGWVVGAHVAVDGILPRSWWVTEEAPTCEASPVDRSKLCTTSGRPVAEVRAGQIQETGQHDGYVVLCPDERAKGFVRPYRDAYRHVGQLTQLLNNAGADSHQVRTGGCGTVTTMGRALSETYARDPTFYGATFCCNCNRHLPVADFVWTADGQQVGS